MDNQQQQHYYSGGSAQLPVANRAPGEDFPAAPRPESLDVYPQHHHWPQQGSSHAYPPHPLFDPSRPPPGYFATSPAPTHSCSSAPKPGHGMDLRPFHSPNRGYQSNMDNYQRNAYQASFQPNSNILGKSDYPVAHHKPDDPPQAPPELSDRNSSQSDAEAWLRKQDAQWICAFLGRRRNSVAPPSKCSPPPPKHSVSDFRQKLYSAVEMLSELSTVCQALKTNLENECVWSDSYARAVALKRDLEDSLKTLSDPVEVDMIKKKLALSKKKRARMCRKKAQDEEERQEQVVRAAAKEAAIDKHQMKKIQEIEEKNRERELKLAADAVLSEVRKKQADAKRMLDILKALEKLRKLRKDAASRKGMFPEKESDQVFEGHLERLRTLIRKRTAVYGAEEKALRVMLEGEQEEERKRDHERRQKKERDKLLQRKREISTMLFGAELPPDHPLQPYQEYYTQAENSLPSLIQIRRDWDQFLVPRDHPDGSTIPQGWVLPDPPTDDVWATALEK